MTAKHSPDICTLVDANIGIRMRVKELRGEVGVCQRLREMGFCEFAEIKKMSEGHALICRVCNCNVVLSRRLAKNIVVEPIHPASSHSK